MANARQKAKAAADEVAEVEETDRAAEPVPIGTAERENEGAAVATGYIRDFISGVRVRATPEEVQATQVFSRRLVEDFGYPTDHITTRPQFRVSRRPSETKKSYPVDIAVFSNVQRLEDDCSIIVECKSETEKAGRKQLEIYLTLSDAFIGVPDYAPSSAKPTAASTC